MNIERIEELTKEIRKKETKIKKVDEQKEMLQLEVEELHDELATIITNK